MSMKAREDELTLEKLNASYVKLIKLVLNGENISSLSCVNRFYHDPSPVEAQELLDNILAETNKINEHGPANKKLVESSERRGQLTPTKKVNRLKSKDSDELFNEFKEVNHCGKQNSFRKTKTIEVQISKQKENKDEINKIQNIRKITNRLTSIFEDNHRKIFSYNQAFKNSPALPLPRNVVNVRR